MSARAELLVTQQIKLFYALCMVSSQLEEELSKGIGIVPKRSLSPREMLIVGLVKQRYSNKEIATRIRVSERTVKFHMTNILSKFGIESRSDLIHKEQK